MFYLLGSCNHKGVGGANYDFEQNSSIISEGHGLTLCCCGDLLEFTVISYWQSRDAIKKFAGEDIEKTHFLPKDPQYLLELEPKVKHFDVLYDGRK